MLERFHGEVRIARQVSHPNVCRVYDIGEVDGAAYISMEYVDGEDLGSLLRRIGRLPGDKAIEIARKLCAGLAAAHAKGVLHRDLKPANIMIDGRGQVLIMDFGLAAIADQVEGAEVRNGTPAYMAPEQLAGREVTERSDIYALGLVLYEIFTGQRAFKTADRSAVPSAASVSEGYRPGDRTRHRALPRTGCGQAPAIGAGVGADAAWRRSLGRSISRGRHAVARNGRGFGRNRRPAPRGGLGLAGRSHCGSYRGDSDGCTNHALPARAARQTTGSACRAGAGYSAKRRLFRAAGGHGDWVLRGKAIFYAYIAAHDKSKTRWDNLETGAFGVLVSRQPPAARGCVHYSPDPYRDRVWTDDPPLDVSGMTLVRLNPLGRLTQLIAVPPQVEKPAETESPASSPDWAPLFSAAGLDPSKWLPAQPTWTPPVYSDVRAAWAGSLAERPDVPMRIEAAAYRGKPVYFELIGPWTRPERMQPYQPTAGERVFQ